MRSLAFLAYLPWLAQATHAVMASSPGSGADCDNTSVSYPVGVSELTFDTDSVINHYATNATKPPAAKHCTFDALCGISERFLDDSFQAGRHAFTGGVEPTNFHSTFSCRFFLGNPLQHLTKLSDKAFTVRNVHVPMRPHPDNTSEATGIKRSNFHFDDQTGSLHAVMQTHTESMPPQHTYGSYASLKPAATNEYAIAVHNHENAFSFNETISHFIGGIALGILSSIALGIFSRCIYLSTRVDSAWYGPPIYVSTYPRAVPPGAFSVMVTILSFITFAHATDPSTTGGDGKQVPLFNGQREAFSAWFMMFTGFVAWKLTECYQLAEGNEARPTIPAPIYGTTDGPTEPDAEAYLEASAPGTPTPAAPPRPSARARTGVVTNQDAIDAAKTAQKDWDERNMKLYGLIIQAMPAWLQTSVFNSHKGKGLEALTYLRTSFDAGEGDGSDHASHLADLHKSVIEPRSDISENDCRKQYDHMMTAVAAIERTGNPKPAEATLIAMFDNSMPTSYSTTRQLVNRAKHPTFLAHYSDYMSSIRSEVSNRRPVPNAYSSFVPSTTNGGDKDVKGDGGHDKGPCTRCGKKGHTKIKCFKPKTECHLCGADHLTAFCINAKGNHRRAELTVSSLETIVKERDEALKFVTPPSDKTGGPSNTPSTDPGELKLAYAAAAAAAASETDPNKAAAAYTACLGAFGYI